jgi:hypothetical protein
MISRTPFWYFVFGACAGALFVLLVTFEFSLHHLQQREAYYQHELEQREREFSQTIMDAQDTQRSLQGKLDACGHTALQQSAQLIQDHGETVDGAPLYTILYEPAAAPTSAQATAMLNLIKPGLGSLLAGARPSQGMAVSWVLRGHIAPIGTPPGGQYTWINVEAH